MNAIIVVCYNDTDSVIEFISNTVHIHNIDKIVIVDNASSNELGKSVQSFVDKNNYKDKVDYINSGRNGGYAYGNNYGLKYVYKKYKPDYISISNSDVILNESSINECLNFLKNHSDVGIVSPQMITPRNTSTKSSWKLPSYCDILKENLFVFIRLFSIFKCSPELRIDNTKVQEVDVIMGSFFMARSELFKEINGFDERTFLYGEENILAYKIKKIGKKNYIINDVNYIHNHSASIITNISSVKTRLVILHNSYRVYLNNYLKVNKLQMLLFELTYYIGTYLYLFYIRMKKVINKK